MYKHFFKRLFDFLISLIVLICLSPFFLVIMVWLHFANKGAGVFFTQERPGLNSKIFKVIKFKSMTDEKDENGHLLPNDKRITSAGRFIRKFSIDELPQLINVLKGEMTFVGTRPEVERYVSKYSPEMYATLLMPAGITSLTSVKYRHEEEILDKADDVEKAYIEEVLPAKMKINLEYISKFNFFYDLYVCILTVVKITD